MTADYTETHPLVDVRRIIGINKKDKYEWVKDLIDKTKPIKNLNLAFINASHIESCFPHSIISCRIIDDNKLFLPYPTLNYVPGGTFEGCTYIESETMVRVYKNYYTKLWEKLKENNVRCGCILKDGINCSDFDEYEAQIFLNLDDNVARPAEIVTPEVRKGMDMTLLLRSN